MHAIAGIQCFAQRLSRLPGRCALLSLPSYVLFALILVLNCLHPWKLIPFWLLLTAQGFARQQTRAFAEKAVAAEVDWDSISALIHSDEGKRELASLRSTFFDIQSRLTGMAKDTPGPDWASWKKDLDPKIVDGFKQAFDSTLLQSGAALAPSPPAPHSPAPLPAPLILAHLQTCYFYPHPDRKTAKTTRTRKPP